MRRLFKLGIDMQGGAGTEEAERRSRSVVQLPTWQAPPVPDLRRRWSARSLPVPSPAAIAVEHRADDIWSARATGATSWGAAGAAPAPIVTQPVTRRSASARVASAQVAIAVVALVAAPSLTLVTHKPSGLAFAFHGIGAVALSVLATLAMHKAYPLMRGGVRTWPSFRGLLDKLALATLAQLGSSVWILHYYLPGTGPLLAQTAPAVDQFAMQFKIVCGLLGFGCFLVAWWSSRRVDGGRGDTSIAAPVFAVAAGWVFMVLALALGTAITWIMPV